MVAGRAYSRLWLSGLLILGLMLLCRAALAQTSDFCLSPSGGCYPTLQEAQEALRSNPDLAPVGQFLEHVETSILGGNIAMFGFEVKPRAPATVSDAMYFAHLGSYGQGQFGCGSAVPGTTNWCYDEAELIQKSLEHIGQVASNETSSCTASNGPIAYEYSSTGTTDLSGVIPFGSRIYRPVTWSCSDGRNGSHYIEILKRHVITCEPGMEPGGSTSANEISTTPLCKSSRQGTVVGPFVQGGQVASCKANPNPCHPATGEKSRAEEDFVFAGRPFVRHYSSKLQFPANSALGMGWSHSFSDSLIESTIWMRGDGTLEPFQSVSFTDRYYGVNSIDTVLDRLSTSSPRYRLRTPDGDVREFNNDRRLTAIRTPGMPDRDISLQYDSGGRLTRAVDIQGRALTFLYRYGRVWQIVLPDGMAVTYDYDVNGNLVKAEYDDGTSKSYHYAESGLAAGTFKNHLTGITDELGNRYASFGYDASGRVTSSRLHAGSGDVATTLVSYGVDGVTTVATADGETRVYEAQPNFYRRINLVADSAGSSANTYQSDGRLQSTTDKNGVATAFTYTGAFLAQRIDAVGTQDARATNYLRDSNGYPFEKKISEVDAGGNTAVQITRVVRDSSGRPLHECVIDPSTSGASEYVCGSLATPSAGVRQMTRTYCSQANVAANLCPVVGLITSVGGARTDISDVTTYTYRMSNATGCDASPAACEYRKGDLWKVANALGQVIETLRYDGAGRPLSVKDANGVVTDFEYHPRGWLTARKVRGTNDNSETDDQITRVAYYPTGLVSSVTLPDGSFTSYVYDAAHRLTDIVDADGNRLHYTLDNAGNRIREEVLGEDDSLKRTLSRVYNQLGQLQTQKDAGSHAMGFTYDANGNTDTVTDALGRVADNDYDPLNRLVRTLQDAGGIAAETKFEYDALDNLTKVTDPKGLDTTYAHNGLGDLTQLSSPDTGTTAYAYDSAGNRISQTDARGVTTNYSYDALNRLIGVAYPGEPALNVTYQYDAVAPACGTGETFAVGRLGQVNDGSGSTQYCYDRFGNTVRKVQATNGQAFALQYAYTQAGQLSAITYPDGTAVDYVRDGQGRIAEIGVATPGNPREVLLTGASYHPFGPVAGWSYGNGRTLTRTVDLDYRPQRIFDPAVGGLDLGFGYDAAGT